MSGLVQNNTNRVVELTIKNVTNIISLIYINNYILKF